MAKKKRQANLATQWKVIQSVEMARLERTLDTWTEKGWAVYQILGVPQGNLAIVLTRISTL